MLTPRRALSPLTALVLATLFAGNVFAAPRTVIGELWSQDN